MPHKRTGTDPRRAFYILPYVEAYLVEEALRGNTEGFPEELVAQIASCQENKVAIGRLLDPVEQFKSIIRQRIEDGNLTYNRVKHFKNFGKKRFDLVIEWSGASFRTANKTASKSKENIDRKTFERDILERVKRYERVSGKTVSGLSYSKSKLTIKTS